MPRFSDMFFFLISEIISVLSEITFWYQKMPWFSDIIDNLSIYNITGYSVQLFLQVLLAVSREHGVHGGILQNLAEIWSHE